MITTRRSGVARRVVEIDVERHRAEQQERHEQERLDDEAADAVERAGGDGRAGRNTLALEEPDVDRDAGGGGRDGQVDVGDRELQGVDGPERQWDRRGTERRHRLGDPGQLRHEQAEQHQPPDRILQRFDELVEIETGERRHEYEHRQQRQRDADDRTDAEPAELHQSWRLEVDRRSHLRTDVVEVEVEGVDHPSLIGRERDRLEIRQERSDALVRTVRNERGDGEIPSGQDHRRDERLRLVAAQLGVGRRHARPAEVDETESAPS